MAAWRNVTMKELSHNEINTVTRNLLASILFNEPILENPNSMSLLKTFIDEKVTLLNFLRGLINIRDAHPHISSKVESLVNKTLNVLAAGVINQYDSNIPIEHLTLDHNPEFFEELFKPYLNMTRIFMDINLLKEYLNVFGHYFIQETFLPSDFCEFAPDDEDSYNEERNNDGFTLTDEEIDRLPNVMSMYGVECSLTLLHSDKLDDFIDKHGIESLEVSKLVTSASNLDELFFSYSTSSCKCMILDKSNPFTTLNNRYALAITNFENFSATQVLNYKSPEKLLLFMSIIKDLLS